MVKIGKLAAIKLDFMVAGVGVGPFFERDARVACPRRQLARNRWFDDLGRRLEGGAPKSPRGKRRRRAAVLAQAARRSGYFQFRARDVNR